MPYKDPEARKAAWRRYYHANQQRLAADIQLRKAALVERNRSYIHQWLSEHPCVDCWEPDPLVLDFDHVASKEAGVCKLMADGLSLARLAAEIAKCEVVCANCHRRRTSMRADDWRYQRHIGGLA